MAGKLQTLTEALTSLEAVDAPAFDNALDYLADLYGSQPWRRRDFTLLSWGQ